jgi:predicted transcriptional regulator
MRALLGIADRLDSTASIIRQEVVRDMRDAQGMSFTAIAQRLGISRQRVQQIYDKAKGAQEASA